MDAKKVADLICQGIAVAWLAIILAGSLGALAFVCKWAWQCIVGLGD